MTEETMLAVVEELRKRGVNATFEYPGFIALHNPLNEIHFGDANETFDGDVYVPGELDRVIETIESDIPSGSDDVQAIATHICCFAERLEDTPMVAPDGSKSIGCRWCDASFQTATEAEYDDSIDGANFDDNDGLADNGRYF